MCGIGPSDPQLTFDPTDLALPFGYVINPGSPQEEEALLPGLLAVLSEVENALQVGHDDRGPTQVLLHNERRVIARLHCDLSLCDLSLCVQISCVYAPALAHLHE